MSDPDENGGDVEASSKKEKETNDDPTSHHKKEKKKKRSRSRSRSRDREKKKRRSRSRERRRSRDKERSRSRDKERKRSKEREKDGRPSKRSRSRSRSKDRERSRRKDDDRGSNDHQGYENDRDRKDTEREESSRARNRPSRFGPSNDQLQENFPVPQQANNSFAASSTDENSRNSVSSPAPTGEDPTKASAEVGRKRKSRWGDEKVIVGGLPAVLPASLNETQQRAYLLQIQIEEINSKLRTGNLGIIENPDERSPSPEPYYDQRGVRLNTREVRKRQELENKRHELIQEMQKLNPAYRPPPDYKPPQVKLFDKVFIPADDYPSINFVGLLIGPRGNTLKQLEKETGARIIIRGKGSTREGKFKPGTQLPGADEPLHAYITANSLDLVKKAKEKIDEVISQCISMPDAENQLRQMQLRELALLNGTMRLDVVSGGCTNCGSTSHKTWECPDRQNVTANVVCALCGNAGHLARDCKNRPPGMDVPTEPSGGYLPMGVSVLDEEYSALMAELGEGAPKRKTGYAGGGGGGAGGPAANHEMEKPEPKPIIRINLAEQMRAMTQEQQMPMPGYSSYPMPGYPSGPYWGQGPGSATGADSMNNSASGYDTNWWSQNSANQWMAPPPPPPGGGGGYDSSTNAGGDFFLAPPPPPPPPPPQ